MAVPKYDEFMLPLLKLAGDKKTHSMSEAYENLAQLFKLTEEDRKEMLPSGQQNIFENRVGWAKLYLKKAGLIYSKERGKFKITDKGLLELKNNPKKIDKEYLRKYPEFEKFQTRPKKQKNKNIIIEDEKTPKDLIEENYQQIHDSLAQDLLEIIKTSADSFFEKLVVDLLVKMGYGGSRVDAGKAIGRSGDQGIDGIINEDKLGLDVIYIQAKRWTTNKIGGGDIRDFVGSLDLKNANKGVFITTSDFTKDAIESAYKSTKNVILINGERLANLMIEHDLAVSTEAKYYLKQIDNDYFENA